MRRGQAALERLQRIEPQLLPPSETVVRSSCRLVREYLRRFGEWSYLTGRLTDLDARDALTFDLSSALAPLAQLPSELDMALRALPLLGHGPVVARNYVRWEFAADLPAVVESGLSEPYEPLVRLLERGGELFTHHGFIHVSHGGSFWPGPLLDYAEREPLADLTDEALNLFDQL
ncbi:MAG: hypothetical protein U0794_15595 [Isosphaeraceae bacterium]